MSQAFRAFAVGLTCVAFVSGCSLLNRKKKDSDAGVVALADPGGASTATAVAPVLASAQPVPAKPAFALGSKGQVLWKGRWYAASVIGLPGVDRYKVHYTGYESSWDEVVGPSRMRGFGDPPSTAAPKTGGGGGSGGSGGGAGGAAAAANAPCPGPGLTRRCSGRCVNLQTDDRNCGSCGNVCPSGKHCDGHLSCRDSAGNL